MVLTGKERERIERKLRGYPRLKARAKLKRREVARLKKRIAEEEYTLSAVDYSLIASGKTNLVVNRMEAQVDRHLDRHPELMVKICELHELEEEIGAIRDTVYGLKEQHAMYYHLVVLKYFQGLGTGDIAEGLGISRPQVYRLRDRALEELVLRGL